MPKVISSSKGAISDSYDLLWYQLLDQTFITTVKVIASSEDVTVYTYTCVATSAMFRW